ncbi:MAG: VWA domain-containing protein [Rhodospirillales bacterium]|nr:VWA domain-containing protein [Rhodospirillales bacterium]
MATPGPASGRRGGHIAANLLTFIRLLRRAGMTLGPADGIAAATALRTVGLRRRDDVYWGLRATLVRRAADVDVFDDAFRALWQGIALEPVGQSSVFGKRRRPAPAQRRVAEALGALPPSSEGRESPPTATTLSASRLERLGSIDVADMSVEEMHAAQEAVQKLVRPLGDLPTRRFRTTRTGRDGIDRRGTLRLASRTGGIPLRLQLRQRRTRPVTVVVLCDISGSMSAYTRMLLHFMHALGQTHRRVFSFVFGTRLTDVTRALRQGDPDRAVQRAVSQVHDWSGGTRIGAALRSFNRLWSRRVLTDGGVVLLVTDGLERDPGVDVGAEAALLRRSCRRLVWLNPLMRYAAFEPRAGGMAAIAAHVDESRTVHTLDSLRALADSLATGPVRHA